MAKYIPSEATISGISRRDAAIVLLSNWVVLLCCFITLYFANQQPWTLLILVAMALIALPAAFGFARHHFWEIGMQLVMTFSVMVAFFSGWAPPLVVILFIATGLLAMVFLLRPWGGAYFVLMSMIVTIPIAISMTGYGDSSQYHTYSTVAIIVATFLMNGVNAYFISLQNKGLRNESTRARNLVRRMQDVHEQFASVISNAPNLEEALWSVADRCIPALGLEDCVIYVLDKKQKDLRQVAAYGPKSLSRGQILSPMRIEIGEGVVGKSARIGQPVLVSDTTRDPDYILDDRKRYSELAVPIFFDGEVYGVIDSEHSERNFFTDDHVVLFQMIASLCAYKIAELQLLDSKLQKANTERELNEISQLEDLRHTFLNNLSHDLRTPLSLIKGPLQELVKSKDPETRKMSEVGLRNALRLNEMVSGLLDMHKLERGALYPVLSVADIGLKSKEWFGLFALEAEKRNIDYTRSADEMPLLKCDVSKIGQIVQNLLSNAFKFTPTGGQIALNFALEGDQLVIETADSGPGIQVEERKKIFDRFYKIDHRSHTEGTGIGLAMVKEFADLLGGQVDVVNGPFNGALFTVSIPVETVEEQVQSTAFPDRSGVRKPMVVLVEDHPEMNAFIAALLAESYQVRTALTAEEGWMLISEYLPDLVITDLMLPGMSGEMLCKRIKTSVSTDHLPVLALSAKQNTDTKVELYTYGADNYLTKPFDSDELKSVVQSLIEQRDRLKSKFRGAPGAHALKSEGMRQIDEIIATKMRDPDFGPRDLEAEIGINRNQLQRKIKSVTGYTPVEYIRVMRLEFAQNLIKRNGVSVSEAAYASGFNQLAYFSKVYKSHFGEPPSAHVSKHKNEFK